MCVVEIKDDKQFEDSLIQRMKSQSVFAVPMWQKVFAGLLIALTLFLSSTLWQDRERLDIVEEETKAQDTRITNLEASLKEYAKTTSEDVENIKDQFIDMRIFLAGQDRYTSKDAKVDREDVNKKLDEITKRLRAVERSNVD